MSLQESSSLFVILLLFLMLTAIKFDNYFFFNAGKIGDECPDRMLTPKAATIELLAS